MITPDDLRDIGFVPDEYDNSWTMEGSITRFGLDEDGLITWFGEYDNFHGLQIQPISDIGTLKQFWRMVTGIQV
jgi:hypothetical protein